jgi:hypothetical protein
MIQVIGPLSEHKVVAVFFFLYRYQDRCRFVTVAEDRSGRVGLERVGDSIGEHRMRNF